MTRYTIERGPDEKIFFFGDADARTKKWAKTRKFFIGCSYPLLHSIGRRPQGWTIQIENTHTKKKLYTNTILNTVLYVIHGPAGGVLWCIIPAPCQYLPVARRGVGRGPVALPPLSCRRRHSDGQRAPLRVPGAGFDRQPAPAGKFGEC